MKLKITKENKCCSKCKNFSRFITVSGVCMVDNTEIFNSEETVCKDNKFKPSEE